MRSQVFYGCCNLFPAHLQSDLHLVIRGIAGHVDYSSISCSIMETTTAWRDFGTAEYANEGDVIEVEDEEDFNEERGSRGENVEPEEIEDAARRSNLIYQIVVVGQDQRRLGALIVPNKEELHLAAKDLMKLKDIASELTIPVLNDLIRQELIK
ncbi:hypothetical protein KI387_019854 [Taxus chinensis]|uniref:Uncharacterized protein n=1 Tax=Taxus chinensis TaxID=29808 RepID=A0AA38GAU9_TAXCH|nr:hypothetical protein KI387_019854 [Taxus chinensis]